MMVVHYNSWIGYLVPKRFGVFTLGNHVFTVYDFLNDHELAHEYCHVLQYRQYGIIGFLVRYAWYSMRHGYWLNPLEVEARLYADAQRDENPW